MDVVDIIKKGNSVWQRHTPENVTYIRILGNYYREVTGYDVSCSWCNRKNLYDKVKTILEKSGKLS